MEKDILIAERYRLARSSKLGQGSFGEIYQGTPRSRQASTRAEEAPRSLSSW